MKGRYVALAAVILVLGGATVAQGASGDPLILGAVNTSADTTTLNSLLDMSTNAIVNVGFVSALNLQVLCSGILTVPAGTNIIGDLDAGGCASSGEMVFATVQGPVNTDRHIWVRDAWIDAPDDEPAVTIRLNTKAPVDVDVARVVMVVP